MSYDIRKRLDAWKQAIEDSYCNPPRLRPINVGADSSPRTDYYWMRERVGSLVFANGWYLVTTDIRYQKIRMAQVRTVREAEEWLMENVPPCRNYRVACRAVDKVIGRAA